MRGGYRVIARPLPVLEVPHLIFFSSADGPALHFLFILYQILGRGSVIIVILLSLLKMSKNNTFGRGTCAKRTENCQFPESDAQY